MCSQEYDVLLECLLTEKESADATAINGAIYVSQAVLLFLLNRKIISIQKIITISFIRVFNTLLYKCFTSLSTVYRSYHHG